MNTPNQTTNQAPNQIPNQQQQPTTKKKSVVPLIIIIVVAVMMVCAGVTLFLATKMLSCAGSAISAEVNDFVDTAISADVDGISVTVGDDDRPTEDDIYEWAGSGVGEGGDYYRAKMSLNFYDHGRYNPASLAVNGVPIKEVMPDVDKIYASIDQSIAVVDSFSQGIYVVSPDGLTMISDSGFAEGISPNGKKGVYSDDGGTYVFDTSGETGPQRIADHGGFYVARFSPDGETLAYTLGGNPDLLNSSIVKAQQYIYFYQNGEARAYKVPARVLSVSDGGEYIFCEETASRSIYLINTLTDEVKTITTLMEGEPIVNAAGTEVVYSTEHGAFYYGVDDGEITLTSTKGAYGLEMVKPNNALNYFDNVVGSQSLKDKVYRISDELVYLDKEANPTMITTVAAGSSAQMGNDGETLYCVVDNELANNELLRIDLSEIAEGFGAFKIASGVDSFMVSDDQLSVYFIDTLGNLKHLEADGSSVKVSGSVTDSNMYYLSNKNSRMYYLSNNKFYYLEAHVSGSREAYDLYCAENGEAPVLVASDIEIPNDDYCYGSGLQYKSCDGENYYFINVNNEEPVKFS